MSTQRSAIGLYFVKFNFFFALYLLIKGRPFKSLNLKMKFREKGFEIFVNLLFYFEVQVFSFRNEMFFHSYGCRGWPLSTSFDGTNF